MAVETIPNAVKETLRVSGLDENATIGILTIERANMMPDIATGKLKNVKCFIIQYC